MNPILIALIAALVYLVVGLILVPVAARGEASSLGEVGCLVVLGWPFFLALFLIERGFAPSPAAARSPRRRLASDPAVGRVGVAVTDLRPTGQVTVDGVTRDARADRFVASGRRVVVTGAGGFGLLVRPADPGTAPDSPGP